MHKISDQIFLFTYTIYLRFKLIDFDYFTNFFNRCLKSIYVRLKHDCICYLLDDNTTTLDAMTFSYPHRKETIHDKKQGKEKTCKNLDYRIRIYCEITLNDEDRGTERKRHFNFFVRTPAI